MKPPSDWQLPSPTLNARLYAALHQGNEGDVAFYLRACKGRKRFHVLELGSGALRIGLELARAGHEVTGVELDEALHHLALERVQREPPTEKRGRVHLVHGDMVEFQTETRFDKVLIPYSALWCLPSVELKRKCLVRAAELLKPEGELILDVYSADHLRDETPRASKRAEPLVDKFELTEHVVKLGDAETYRVFERNLRWPSQKHTRVEYGLAHVSNDAYCWLMIVDHYYLWRHELSELLEDAGFETDWGADHKAHGSAFEQQIVVRGFKQA